MAPLQKRALYSLILGAALAIALIVVITTRDIYSFDTDQGFRLLVYVLWIGVPIIYLIAVDLTLRKPNLVDERDRSIIERAPKIQWITVIFTLVAWVIILTEAFWSEGEVPLIFLTLIFISVLVISTLAQSLGILIGYWKMR